MFHQVYRTPVVAVRPFMTYGPGQRAHKLIPYVTQALLRGEAPKLSSGTRPVDWIYVDDVIDGVLTAARARGVEGSTLDVRPRVLQPLKDYAHSGHRDCILCVACGAGCLKSYSLNYTECLSNDFTLSEGGKSLRLFNSDIDDLRITFAHTGTTSTIGQRLKAVEKYLENEDMFLANCSDGLTDVPLDDQIDHFKREDKAASFLCVNPNLSCQFITPSQG